MCTDRIHRIYVVLAMLSSFRHAARGLTISRCYNEMFDALLCLPNTQIEVTHVTVTAATDGGPLSCRQSHDNCNKLLPTDDSFTERVDGACAGKIVCENLRASAAMVECEEGSSLVEVSYMTITYECSPVSTNDVHYIVSCPTGGVYQSLTCQEDTMIQADGLYVGTWLNDGTECKDSFGDCAYGLARGDSDVVTSFRDQCNGRKTCIDIESYNLTGPCGGSVGEQFTMIVYKCLTPAASLPQTTSTTNHPISTPSTELTTNISGTSAGLTNLPVEVTQGDIPEATTQQDRLTRELRTFADLTPTGVINTTGALTGKGSPGSRPMEVLVGVPVASALLLIIIILAIVLSLRRHRRSKLRCSLSVHQYSHNGEHAGYVNPTFTQLPNPFYTERDDDSINTYFGSHHATMSREAENDIAVRNAPYPYAEVAIEKLAPSTLGASASTVGTSEPLTHTHAMAPKTRHQYDGITMEDAPHGSSQEIRKANGAYLEPVATRSASMYANQTSLDDLPHNDAGGDTDADDDDDISSLGGSSFDSCDTTKDHVYNNEILNRTSQYDECKPTSETQVNPYHITDLSELDDERDLGEVIAQTSQALDFDDSNPTKNEYEEISELEKRRTHESESTGSTLTVACGGTRPEHHKEHNNNNVYSKVNKNSGPSGAADKG